jgi:hypothetical protein
VNCYPCGILDIIISAIANHHNTPFSLMIDGKYCNQKTYFNERIIHVRTILENISLIADRLNKHSSLPIKSD